VGEDHSGHSEDPRGRLSYTVLIFVSICGTATASFTCTREDQVPDASTRFALLNFSADSCTANETYRERSHESDRNEPREALTLMIPVSTARIMCNCALSEVPAVVCCFVAGTHGGGSCKRELVRERGRSFGRRCAPRRERLRALCRLAARGRRRRTRRLMRVRG
jgi:hypothetical protein